jgi:hypothetical protein
VVCGDTNHGESPLRLCVRNCICIDLRVLLVFTFILCALGVKLYLHYFLRFNAFARNIVFAFAFLKPFAALRDKIYLY